MPANRWFVLLATWFLLLGLYLVLEGGFSSDEIVAGAVSAAAGTGLAALVHRLSDRDFRFRRQAFRPLRRAAWALVADTLRVAFALMRVSPPPGAIRRERFVAAGREPDQAACRALMVLSESVAPRSYVIALLHHDEEMLLHRLT